jgi:hypothetical protein
MAHSLEENNNHLKLSDLISITEASEISGLTTRHIRYLAAKGEIWARKLGRNWFTTEESVRSYLARERKPGPKPHN